MLSRDEFDTVKKVRLGFATPDRGASHPAGPRRGARLRACPIRHQCRIRPGALRDLEPLAHNGHCRRPGLPVLHLRSVARAPGPARAQRGRGCGARRADCVLYRRHPDHGRHRLLDAVRGMHFFQFVRRWSTSSARSGIRASPPGRSGGGEGQFGLLPLLWGTLYISPVALWSLSRSGCLPRSTCRSTPVATCGRLPSRCSRSSPASRPSSTASSR